MQNWENFTFLVFSTHVRTVIYHFDVSSVEIDPFLLKPAIYEFSLVKCSKTQIAPNVLPNILS